MVIKGMSCDLPWRIHWRLSGADPGPFLAGIRRARPLSLVMEVDDPCEIGSFGFPWENTSVVVVLHGWKVARHPLPREGVLRWEFPVAGLEEAKDAGRIARDVPSSAALRWTPVRSNLTELPDIMETVYGNGTGLTLPNRPADGITARKDDDLPDYGVFGPDELHRMEELGGALGPRRLRIHDFILSALLGIGGPEPGGCGAADSMVFVTGSGEVFPCDSLAVRMGNLGDETLESIWRSPIRRRIRRDISAVPSVCGACEHLSGCLGGCRGASFHWFGHFGAPDPGCRKESPVSRVQCPEE